SLGSRNWMMQTSLVVEMRTLVLTERDTAKTLAVAGLSEVGNDNYGIFPLWNIGTLMEYHLIFQCDELQTMLNIVLASRGLRFSDSFLLRCF
ncbi:9917_t:CDS:2, partial [Funneliformis geosporum]